EHVAGGDVLAGHHAVAGQPLVDAEQGHAVGFHRPVEIDEVRDDPAVVRVVGRGLRHAHGDLGDAGESVDDPRLAPAGDGRDVHEEVPRLLQADVAVDLAVGAFLLADV